MTLMRYVHMFFHVDDNRIYHQGHPNCPVARWSFGLRMSKQRHGWVWMICKLHSSQNNTSVMRMKGWEGMKLMKTFCLHPFTSAGTIQEPVEWQLTLLTCFRVSLIITMPPNPYKGHELWITGWGSFASTLPDLWACRQGLCRYILHSRAMVSWGCWCLSLLTVEELPGSYKLWHAYLQRIPQTFLGLVQPVLNFMKWDFIDLDHLGPNLSFLFPFDLTC